MEKIVKDMLNGIKMPGALDIGRCVLLAMRAAEEYSNSGNGLSGVEKCDLAMEWVERIVEQGMAYGLVDPASAFTMLNEINGLGDDLRSVIDTIVAVSKNPQFIQLKDEAVKMCCPSAMKRPTRASGSASRSLGGKRRARKP